MCGRNLIAVVTVVALSGCLTGTPAFKEAPAQEPTQPERKLEQAPGVIGKVNPTPETGTLVTAEALTFKIATEIPDTFSLEAAVEAPVRVTEFRASLRQGVQNTFPKAVDVASGAKEGPIHVELASVQVLPADAERIGKSGQAGLELKYRFRIGFGSKVRELSSGALFSVDRPALDAFLAKILLEAALDHAMEVLRDGVQRALSEPERAPAKVAEKKPVAPGLEAGEVVPLAGVRSLRLGLIGEGERLLYEELGLHMYSGRSQPAAWVSSSEGVFLLDENGRHGPFTAFAQHIAPEGIGWAASRKTAKGFAIILNGVEQGTYPAAGMEIAVGPGGRGWAARALAEGGLVSILAKAGSFGPYEEARILAVSSDGAHWAADVSRGADSWLVIDGKEYGPYPEGYKEVVFSRDGRRWGATLQKNDGKWWLMVDSKEYGPFIWGTHLAFSPIKDTWLAAGQNPDNTWQLLQDGKSFGPYESMDRYPSFSPDGSHWSYQFKRNEWYSVVDGREYGPLDSALPVEYSRDGSGWICGVYSSENKSYRVIVNGKESEPFTSLIWLSTAVSRQGASWLAWGRGQEDPTVVLHDGREVGRFGVQVYRFLLSSDGRAWACGISNRGGGITLVVDGKVAAVDALSWGITGLGEQELWYWYSLDGNTLLYNTAPAWQPER